MPPVLSIVAPFRGKPDLDAALEATVRLNELQLRADPSIPLLYSAAARQLGVRYARDVCLAPQVPGACERFLTIASALMELRSGAIAGLDCDDLASWRCAELRVRFSRSRARAFVIRSPGIGWHVLVDDGRGKIEDPSKTLGMGPNGR